MTALIRSRRAHKPISLSKNSARSKRRKETDSYRRSEPPALRRKWVCWSLLYQCSLGLCSVLHLDKAGRAWAQGRSRCFRSPPFAGNRDEPRDGMCDALITKAQRLKSVDRSTDRSVVQCNNQGA
jgi:hypothetical protein